VTVLVGVLLGDTNKTGLVATDDVSSAQPKVGHTITGTNFRDDVILDGAITSTDVNLVQSKIGTALL
jgi:hypothetical protein